jgi:hypothetical protein
MAVTINASTTSGFVMTSDLSGSLVLQSNGTTVATVAPTTLTTTLNSASSQAPLITQINGTEVARVDSSGNLLVGTNTAVSVGAGSHILALKASGTSWGVGPTSSFGNFYVKAASSFGVVLTSSATSWASDSDERKKTTLTPFTNPVEKICSLRSGTGRYLVDDENVSRSFLIAQDVQKVLPEAVDIAENEDKTLQLRYTDVIPLLVASIKELKAEIDMLKLKVGA